MIEGVQIPTDHTGRVVAVVGSRPDDQPYLWIGSNEDGCYATLGEREMKKLRDGRLGDDS